MALPEAVATLGDISAIAWQATLARGDGDGQKAGAPSADGDRILNAGEERPQQMPLAP